MMYPRGIRSLFSRFRALPRRRKLIYGAAFALFLAAALVVVFMLLRDGGAAGGGGSAAPSSLTEQMEFPTLTPEPTLNVSQIVEATLEALRPTATPIPTPDVGATVQASVGRQATPEAPVMVLNPLDSFAPRNPYLNREELRELSGLGDEVWSAVQAYFILLDVVSGDFSEITLLHLDQRLDRVNTVLAAYDSLRPLPTPAGGEARTGPEVGPEVQGYVEYVKAGIDEVREAADVLEESAKLFRDGGAGSVFELEPELQDRLRQHYRSMELHLLRFYSVMASYGCSVCGELYRSPGGLR